MAETYHFALPLLAAAQAQKHVTVNEALARLDALAALRVVSASVSTPPANPADGESYIVPASASGAWQGQGGRIALWANGGWAFVAAKPGWAAWNQASESVWRYDGGAWQDEAVVVRPTGAATGMGIVELDHSIAAGATSTTANVIPAHSLVLGVTARVTAEITGPNSGATWKLGVPGAANRYANGLGLAKDSYAQGLSNPPQAYYSPTPLLISSSAGGFTGGAIRFAVHTMRFEPPRPV